MIIQLNLPDGGYCKPVIRAFKADDNSYLALVGEDFDSHELWRIRDSKAVLAGTMTEPSYKKMRRTHNLSIDRSMFDYIDGDWADFSGRVTQELPDYLAASFVGGKFHR